MNILSLPEKNKVQSAADQLCQVIDGHAKELRNAELGLRFTLDDCSFRVVQADRNTVYRVTGRSDDNWYLKLPRCHDADCIARERLGLDAATTALAGAVAYRHPSGWRVSAENAYVLTAKVPGRSLLTSFYRSLLSPLPGTQRKQEKEFGHLGNCLALLHEVQVTEDLTQTRPLREGLLSECRQAKHPDDLCRQVELAADNLQPLPGATFTHGNLGLNNVLSFDGRITMIDFECSGRGSAYDDLSIICGNLLYASAASHISRRKVQGAINALLAGYQQRGCLDHSLLSQCVTLRVGQKYVYFMCNDRRPTVAGLPLSQRRFSALLSKLLDESNVK